MYDIRQFRPALYVLLLLGITGFALASESAAVWVLGAGGVIIHAWLVRRGSFRPLPRPIANTITIGAMLYVAHELQLRGESPILLIGQFLVLLQLVKLFELRANRDYAQLLILSLLLMVAAAINTASLIFGLLFAGWLFVALYVCLLFHLKVETDAAKSAQTLPPDRLNAATLRQDQRLLPRSMRRLTAVVSLAAIFAAVVVFITFPRGAGAGMFGQLQYRPAQALTGMTEQLEFQQVAQITQNNELVAYVQVWHNQTPIRGTETLFLRMLTYDAYDRSTKQWSNNNAPIAGGVPLEAEEMRLFEHGGGSTPFDAYRQHVRMQPTGIKAIPTLAGVQSFKSNHDLDVQYRPKDGTLRSGDSLKFPLEYEVVSRGTLTNPREPMLLQLIAPLLRSAQRRVARDFVVDADPSKLKGISPRIRAYISRDDVAGKLLAERAAGNLDPARDVTVDIAKAVENHLQSNFSYTLDLTDARKIIDGQDPVEAFLYDTKRGHCEYFAGAMTMMLQSVGIRARVVTGFRADEYNALGDYYILRQSQAHAWVEVLTRTGWQTFDPTSGRGDPTNTAQSAWRSVRHFFDFLQFKWADVVITYDNTRRSNLYNLANDRLGQTMVDGNNTARSFSEYFGKGSWSVWFYKGASGILTALTGLLTTLIFLAIGAYLFEQWRLRRRAARIGLDALPTSDQRRMLRQLSFYEELTRDLAKHGIVRPAHLTPMEFSESLSFLPAQAFQSIRRLTRVFYRIRFGRAQLNSGLLGRLTTVVGRVGVILDERRV